jgi:hypothetical protein
MSEEDLVVPESQPDPVTPQLVGIKGANMDRPITSQGSPLPPRSPSTTPLYTPLATNTSINLTGNSHVEDLGLLCLISPRPVAPQYKATSQSLVLGARNDSTTLTYSSTLCAATSDQNGLHICSVRARSPTAPIFTSLYSRDCVILAISCILRRRRKPSSTTRMQRRSEK